MRAAAIFGLGSSEKNLQPFRKEKSVEWLIGLPSQSSAADTILVFGGDGTIHRHLAQLVRLALPVLIVPCGSGNDFARALGLRNVRDSLAAWKDFCSHRTKAKPIDLGLITPLDPSSQAPSYFCCVGGVGLDGEISRRANRLPRWLRGHGGYALSLPGALLGLAAWKTKILVPESDGWQVHRDRPTVLAAFANTPVYGGGMRIAPQAQLDDGKLDICLVTDVNRFKLFCLFPTVYFGRHLRLPEVEYFQAERIRVLPETPLDVYADGEYVCRTPVEVSLCRNALQVLVRSAA